MSDTITISQLNTQIIIGVYPHEQQIKQPVLWDITIPVNSQAVAKDNDLSKGVDYGALTEQLQQWLQTHTFSLIESLAESAAEFLLQQFSLPWVRLSITKKQALFDANGVILTIERQAS